MIFSLPFHCPDISFRFTQSDIYYTTLPSTRGREVSRAVTTLDDRAEGRGFDIHRSPKVNSASSLDGGGKNEQRW